MALAAWAVASAVQACKCRAAQWRGKPQIIRSDNGPEYISSKLVLWAEKHGIRLEHIQPGNPQQNAYVERYNRTVRYDWLGHYLFESMVRASRLKSSIRLNRRKL